MKSKNNKEDLQKRINQGKLIEKSFYIGLISGIIFSLSPMGDKINEKLNILEKKLGINPKIKYQAEQYQITPNSHKENNLKTFLPYNH